MKKTLTLCLSLCLLASITKAQILLSEDFSTATGTTPPAGWTQNLIVGDPIDDQWRFDNPAGRSLNAPITNPAAIFDSDFLSDNSMAENVALESPVFNASGNFIVGLVFDHYFQGGFGGEYFVEAFNGTSWDTVLTGTSSTGNPQQEVIDISSSVAGVPNAQIRFRWEGNYSWYWIVDNVTVIAPQPNDIGVIEVLEPNDGCGLSSSETVTVAIQNFGLLTQSTFNVGFMVDGGAVTSEAYTGVPLAPGMIDTFTFAGGADLSAIGSHQVTAFTQLIGDAQNSNDSTSIMVTHTPQISSLPYQETFISGPSFWMSGGANSTWALGTPAKTVINSAASDTNSWVTGGLGTGSYLANEASYVLSPCFDMTSADTNTVVAMSIWWESEGSWDGTVLQSTNDGGATWTTIGAFGDPGNWYNYDESNIFSSLPESWSGLDSDGEGSGGWVKAIHSLDSTIIGKPEVRFRIAFSSDGSVQEEGFAFDDFTLGVPPQVDFGTDSITACIGQDLTSGFIDPNYTYLWSNGETTPSISILNGSGADSIVSVWVQVTDTLGLTGSDTVKLLIPASSPVISAVVDNDVLCNGDSTGQATVSGTGGFGTYTYVWGTNPPQNQAIATGLPAGTYDVIIIDEYNCSDATTVTITEPPSLAAAVDSVIDASCYGDSTGGVNVTISGGTMPYSFVWDDGSTTEDLAGVPAGMYTGTVTDANGCVLMAGPISVSEPDSISVALASVTDTDCPGDSTGAIDITVSGGTSPYTFNWSNGGTTEDLTGLPVGSYTGTVVDDNGCVFVSVAIDVVATDSLPLAAFGYMPGDVDYEVDFTNTSTNATSYTWDFGDGGTSMDENPSHAYTTNGDYTVTLTATNDCGSVTLVDTISITQVGIEDDLLSSKVTVYPNPSSAFFDVTFDQVNLEGVTLALTTVDGRTVYNKNLGKISGLFTHRIELSNSIARGVYVLRITSNEGVVHRRLRLE